MYAAVGGGQGKGLAGEGMGARGKPAQVTEQSRGFEVLDGGGSHSACVSHTEELSRLTTACFTVLFLILERG